jgi:hypothetical protein
MKSTFGRFPSLHVKKPSFGGKAPTNGYVQNNSSSFGASHCVESAALNGFGMGCFGVRRLIAAFRKRQVNTKKRRSIAALQKWRRDHDSVRIFRIFSLSVERLCAHGWSLLAPARHGQMPAESGLAL